MKPADLDPHCFYTNHEMESLNLLENQKFVQCKQPIEYSKTCVKRPPKNRLNKDLNDK